MTALFYWINCTTLGDTICCIPMTKALIAEDKLIKVIVQDKFADLFRICDVDDRFLHVGPKEANRELATSLRNDGARVIPALLKGFAPLRVHLVDSFTVCNLNAILKPEEKSLKANYKKLVPYPIEKPYIVIGAGYTNESRKMPVQCFNDIVKDAKSHGLGVVLLGAPRAVESKHPIHFEDYPTDGCIDLIGKTSLMESISIISDASCLVAVDSGIVYLGSLTDTPIVAGYTFVDPYYRMPWRHGEHGWRFTAIEPRSKCKYCSNRLALFKVTFDITCPFGKDYECATSLNSKDFTKAIKKAIWGRVSK